MSIVWGLIFNRYSLLILAVVIVAALVGAQKLIWNKATIGGLLVLALGIGLWSLHDRWVKTDRLAATAPYIKLIKDNNDAAEAKLKELTDKIEATTRQLKFAIIDQEKTNATNLQTIVTNNQRPPIRLRDPYKTGSSGSCPQTGSTGNPQSGPGNGTEASGLLSTQASADIWGTDFEADRINVAYIACRTYAYKVMEAMIAQTESGGIVLAMAAWPSK